MVGFLDLGKISTNEMREMRKFPKRMPRDVYPASADQQIKNQKMKRFSHSYELSLCIVNIYISVSVQVFIQATA